jgi:succinoglycan biosynthesis protein ExoM
VRELASTYDGVLRYRHAGSANLSIARNTVIEEGLTAGDWLVFIDDDCLPDDEWLHRLLEVQARTSADMVTGHVVYRARPGAPRWLMDEPFLDYTSYEDGSEPDFGNTANVLLSTRFLRDSGVRFRPTLGLTGGEDMTFYADARAAGAALRYSAQAVVYEPLTTHRERLGYHLHRQFWLGNNMVVINRHTHREAMPRLLVRGVKRVVVSLLQPALRLRKGQPAQVRWSVAYAGQGLGLVLGVLGVTVRHRP